MIVVLLATVLTSHISAWIQTSIGYVGQHLKIHLCLDPCLTKIKEVNFRLNRAKRLPTVNNTTLKTPTYYVPRSILRTAATKSPTLLPDLNNMNAITNR